MVRPPPYTLREHPQTPPFLETVQTNLSITPPPLLALIVAIVTLIGPFLGTL